MLETMKELLKTNDICVLATESNGKPHCSLMAYVCDEDCRHVYMVTDRDSIKFRNLEKSPGVSLLVDTRETHGRARRSETKALTVDGTYKPIVDETTLSDIRGKLLEAHPQLTVFLSSLSARIISVEIESFLLLNGLTDASYEKL